MADGGVSKELQAFLYDRISSYDQLEAVLLVRQAGGEWTARSASEKLNISESAASAALEELCVGNLLKNAESGNARVFIFAAENRELEATLSNLAREYEDNRLEIVKLMT